MIIAARSNDYDDLAVKKSRFVRAIPFTIAAVIVAIGWLFVAPWVGMGSVGVAAGYYLASTCALATIGTLSFEPKVIRALLMVLGTAVFVYALLAITTWLQIKYLLANPPPRPMFHNQFVQHERVLLPYWYSPLRMSDLAGTRVWADYADNILVIVVSGRSGGSSFGSCHTGMLETRFSIPVDHTKEKDVVIPRVKNRLIFILPDQTKADFELEEKCAQQFYEECRASEDRNLLNAAAALLTADDRIRFDALRLESTSALRSRKVQGMNSLATVARPPGESVHLNNSLSSNSIPWRRSNSRNSDLKS